MKEVKEVKEAGKTVGRDGVRFGVGLHNFVRSGNLNL